ncbi:hypothetical protein ACFTAO_32865 [Paenibacillus rhizoplanae]
MAGQRVLLQGNVQITYLPLSVATRISIIIGFAYNFSGSASFFHSFNFQTIVQGYGSDMPDPGQRASVQIPFSLTHLPEPGTGTYTVFFLSQNSNPQDNVTLTAERRYLVVEAVDGGTISSPNSDAYFSGGGRGADHQCIGWSHPIGSDGPQYPVGSERSLCRFNRQ